MDAPAMLFGNTRETSLAWKRIIQKLWEAPDESSIFQSLALSSLDKGNEPIVVQDWSPGWRTVDNVWHLNWINNCWLFPGGSGWTSWKKQLRIIMAGLQHPWYCMGMLPLGFNDLFFTRREYVLEQEQIGDAEYMKTIYIPWFDRMLYWLNDIAPYASRFRHASAGCDLWVFEDVAWMRVLFLAAVESKFLEPLVLTQLPQMSYRDAVETLVASKHIEWREGRLRVAEAG